MMEPRTLTASEIECRVGTISKEGKGLSLLLYKDARVDMRLMDELYGPLGWQRKHEAISGNLYCIVSVWDEAKQQWISKMDVGVESNAEKEKGQASDSFKRACFNFGIGRELYTSPFIWINKADAGLKESRNGYLYTDERFKVKTIGYNDRREINRLEITNKAGKVVYSYGSPAPAATKAEVEPDNDLITEPMLITLRSEIKRTGGSESNICKWAQVDRLEDMAGLKAAEALHILRKQPDAPDVAPIEGAPFA